MARKKSRKSDAIAMLEADHRKVEELFEEFEDGEESAERQQTAERIFHELEVHSQLEEEIFYPALAAQGEEMRKLVDEARQAHQQVKDLIQQLRSLQSADDDQFDEKMQELKQNVEQHVEEEEGELFPEAKSELGEQMKELGARLEESKRELEARA
jgi:hemerythrin superfamily protein